MKKNILTTSLAITKKPVTAFVLSFFITGLGQLYNGSLARGYLFLTGKTMAFITLPLFLTRITGSEITVYLFLTLFLSLFFSIWAPIDSVVKNLNGKNISSKRRKPVPVAIFILMFLVTHSLSVFLIISSISFYRVTGSQGPLFQKGDILIINRICTSSPGDLILAENKITRIISKESNTIELQQNNIIIKNTLLSLAPLSDTKKEIFSIKSQEGVLIEKNNGFSYPVEISLKQPNRLNKSFKLKKKHVFTVEDNRTNKNFYSIIPDKAISGRAEGILSFSLSRIFIPLKIREIVKEKNVITPIDD